jgi:hypothetical protein
MNERHPGDNEPDINLAEFDEDFADAPIEEREFDQVPDGKFHVNVDKVEITTAKTSGNAMLKWTLRILAPSSVGRLLWRNHVMATRENIRWLKNDLHLCGLDLVKLSDLPDNLERLLDVKLEVTKRTKGENVNIYFNRRLASDEGAPSTGASDDFGGAHTGDLPF